MRTESDRMRALEAQLDGMLRPIAPPSELLLRLRGRLRFPERSVIISRIRDWQTLMLVLGGALSGGLVVLTLARALFHLVGRRHVG